MWLLLSVVGPIVSDPFMICFCSVFKMSLIPLLCFTDFLCLMTIYRSSETRLSPTVCVSVTVPSRFLWCSFSIMKTHLYNFHPLKPYFYVLKLGFTGVYIIFLISAQKHRLWVLVRTDSARLFSRVLTNYVLSRNMKNIRYFIWKLSLFGCEIFSIFE